MPEFSLSEINEKISKQSKFIDNLKKSIKKVWFNFEPDPIIQTLGYRMDIFLSLWQFDQ